MKKIKLLLVLLSFFISGAHYTCAYGVVPDIHKKKFSGKKSVAKLEPDDKKSTADSVYYVANLNAMYRQFLMDNDLYGSKLKQKYHAYYSGKYGGYVQKALLHYYDLALIDKRFDIPLQWYDKSKRKECCLITGRLSHVEMVQLSDIPKPLLENQHTFAHLLMHFVERNHRNHKKGKTHDGWFPDNKSQLIWFALMGKLLGDTVSNTVEHTEHIEKYFLRKVAETDFTGQLKQFGMANNSDTPYYFERLVENLELSKLSDTEEINEVVSLAYSQEIYDFYRFYSSDCLMKRVVSDHFPWSQLQTISLKDCQRLINQVEKLQDPVLRKAILLPVVYALENNPSYEEPWQQPRLAATAFSEYQELKSRFACHMAHGSVWFSVFYHHYLKDLIRFNEKNILNERLKWALSPDTVYVGECVSVLRKRGGILPKDVASKLLEQALSPTTPYVGERVSVLRELEGILPKDVASKLLEQALSPTTPYISERVSVLRELGGILPEKVASALLEQALSPNTPYVRERVSVLRKLGGTLSEEEVSARLKLAYGDETVSVLMEMQGQFTLGGFQATTRR
ncbi:hypothetical protein [Candidatus Sororendozoicomonas aggregata]|uniref:hypothetical protein n=1 Tax=Candidatus Sororendozoicomonas aggregata TaxID=3073239 RepID=UPI002ED40155